MNRDFLLLRWGLCKKKAVDFVPNSEKETETYKYVQYLHNTHNYISLSFSTTAKQKEINYY